MADTLQQELDATAEEIKQLKKRLWELREDQIEIIQRMRDKEQADG